MDYDAVNWAQLMYSTYIGGSGNDVAKDVYAPTRHCAYVVGRTTSSNFPVTTGAYNETYGGGTDAFALRISGTMSSLDWCTYIGASGYDYALACQANATGALHVVGYTSSANFPVSVGANQTSFGGGTYDAFAAKVTSDGSALVYATYLGGDGDDYAEAVATQGDQAVLAGHTTSTDFPATTHALNSSLWGTSDAVLVRLNESGSWLNYSTYLGGSGADYCYALADLNDTHWRLAGTTTSADFPTTDGACDQSYSSGTDWFVASLRPEPGPVIKVTHAPSSVNIYSNFTITANVTALYGVTAVNITFGGVEHVMANNTAWNFTWSQQQGASGVHNYTLTAWDSLGAATTTPLASVLVVGTPVTVAVIADTLPCDLSQEIAIVVNVTDSQPLGAGIASVWIYIQGAWHAMSNNTMWNYTYSCTATDPGLHSYVICAYDALGNSGTTGTVYYVVGDKPYLGMPRASATRVESGTTWSVALTVLEDRSGDSGLDSVALVLEDSNRWMSQDEDRPGVWLWAGVLQGNTTRSWYIRARDLAGNVNTTAATTLRLWETGGALNVTARARTTTPGLTPGEEAAADVAWIAFSMVMGGLALAFSWLGHRGEAKAYLWPVPGVIFGTVTTLALYFAANWTLLSSVGTGVFILGYSTLTAGWGTRALPAGAAVGTAVLTAWWALATAAFGWVAIMGVFTAIGFAGVLIPDARVAAAVAITCGALSVVSLLFEMGLISWGFLPW